MKMDFKVNADERGEGERKGEGRRKGEGMDGAPPFPSPRGGSESRSGALLSAPRESTARFSTRDLIPASFPASRVMRKG